MPYREPGRADFSAVLRRRGWAAGVPLLRVVWSPVLVYPQTARLSTSVHQRLTQDLAQGHVPGWWVHGCCPLCQGWFGIKDALEQEEARLHLLVRVTLKDTRSLSVPHTRLSSPPPCSSRGCRGTPAGGISHPPPSTSCGSIIRTNSCMTFKIKSKHSDDVPSLEHQPYHALMCGSHAEWGCTGALQGAHLEGNEPLFSCPHPRGHFSL